MGDPVGGELREALPPLQHAVRTGHGHNNSCIKGVRGKTSFLLFVQRFLHSFPS